jgi:hypothetical protein
MGELPETASISTIFTTLRPLEVVKMGDCQD